MFRKELNLFEEAKHSKILLNGFLSTFIAFLMIIIGQIIGEILFIKLHGLIQIKEIMAGSLMLIFLFGFSLLLCLLWVRFVEKRKLRTIGLGRNKFFVKFLIGFGIGFLMFSVVTLMMYVTGTIKINQNINIGIKFLPSVLAILPGWILQSSTEEIITRGWLMHIIGARHKPFIGFIVSSIIFGLLHIFNPGVGIVSILNIVLVGCLFGLYVIKTHDIWGVCGLHAAWNFTQGNIYGFSVSGLDISNSTLMSFTTNGSVLLTGGHFGPEASIFSTIVLALAIIVLIMKRETISTI